MPWRQASSPEGWQQKPLSQATSRKRGRRDARTLARGHRQGHLARSLEFKEFFVLTDKDLNMPIRPK